MTLFFDEIDSTSDEALRRIRAGAASEDAIIARRQTAGRGRMGRRWASPEGNLYMTLMFQAPALAHYGFWSMMHEARTDLCMWLGTLFLVIVGAGRLSVDALLARRKAKG